MSDAKRTYHDHTKDKTRHEGINYSANDLHKQTC